MNRKDKMILEALPEEYKNTLIYVRESAIDIFQDKLYNLTLGGSGGKGNIIEGFSDLDLYIVLEEHDLDKETLFMEQIEPLKIHVGTTFYTLDEIEADLIDFKTKVMCYEKQIDDVNPTIYGINVFKEIDYETVKQNDINYIPNALQDIRRRYANLRNSEDNTIPKEYIKKLLVLLKCILSKNDVFSYGYDRTTNRFKELCLEQGVDLTPIKDFDIIHTIHHLENKKEVLKFSTFLLNYIDYCNKKEGEKNIWKKELVLEQS